MADLSKELNKELSKDFAYCEDTISRQAAIDAYGDWYVEEGTEEGFIGTVKQLLEGLPSAQPATNCSEIPNGSDDTISRQAAIDALADMHCKSDEDEYVWIIRSDAWARIDALPSAQPERMKGKWKRVYLDHEAMGKRPSVLYCSICNQCIAYSTNFCPNCGADMRGEQDDSF